MTIGEAAKASGVPAKMIRYYERIGLVEVPLDGAGRRLYDREAVGRVVFITRLRDSDMPIAAIARSRAASAPYSRDSGHSTTASGPRRCQAARRRCSSGMGGIGNGGTTGQRVLAGQRGLSSPRRVGPLCHRPGAARGSRPGRAVVLVGCG